MLFDCPACRPTTYLILLVRNSIRTIRVGTDIAFRNGLPPRASRCISAIYVIQMKAVAVHYITQSSAGILYGNTRRDNRETRIMLMQRLAGAQYRLIHLVLATAIVRESGVRGILSIQSLNGSNCVVRRCVKPNMD